MAFTPIGKSSPQPQQKCDNCGGTVGRLEPLYTWGEHFVCAGCYSRLSTAPHLPSELPSEPTVLFRADNVTVTTERIFGQGRSVPMSQVLSVKSRRPFWPGGLNIEVVDLVEHR